MRYLPLHEYIYKNRKSGWYLRYSGDVINIYDATFFKVFDDEGFGNLGYDRILIKNELNFLQRKKRKEKIMKISELHIQE